MGKKAQDEAIQFILGKLASIAYRKWLHWYVLRAVRWVMKKKR